MICVIPARGGSRRIPKKNIRPFHGRPILSYALETAVESKLFTEIVVSTDDREIAAVARDYCPAVLIHRRGPREARDETGTQEVMQAVLSALDVTLPYACCLYATTPLLTPNLLRTGYEALRLPYTQYVLSVGTEPLRDAGTYYWGHTDAFREGVPLLGPTTRLQPLPENRVCDINTPEDWQQAEQMYSALTERLMHYE